MRVSNQHKINLKNIDTSETYEIITMADDVMISLFSPEMLQACHYEKLKETMFDFSDDEHINVS